MTKNIYKTSNGRTHRVAGNGGHVEESMLTSSRWSELNTNYRSLTRNVLQGILCAARDSLRFGGWKISNIPRKSRNTRLKWASDGTLFLHVSKEPSLVNYCIREQL